MPEPTPETAFEQTLNNLMTLIHRRNRTGKSNKDSTKTISNKYNKTSIKPKFYNNIKYLKTIIYQTGSIIYIYNLFPFFSVINNDF